jgi:hypothetical protein
MTAASARYVPQHVMQQAALIAWTTRLGAVTPEAVAEHEQVPVAEAQERLDEAAGLGLLERKAILVGYSALYTVTVAGRKLARKYQETGDYKYVSGIKKCHVTIKSARHLIACASVAATLERRYPDHRVCGELELHKDEREQGHRLVSVEIQSRIGRQSHAPDIVIWPPDEPGEPQSLPIAVEVELTKKSMEELTEICRALARCRQIQATLYFAETQKIEEKLLAVIERLKAQEIIVVNPLSEIVQSLSGFDLSPQESDV